MQRKLKRISSLLVFLTATSAGLAQEAIDFQKDIEPVFRTRCHVCHGPQQQMSGLRLDRAQDGLRGGYSGPAIVPGESSKSR